MYDIRTRRPRSISLAILMSAILIASVSGCGTSVPAGKVTGQVIRKGVPVTQGEVNLYAKAKGSGASAKIGPNGTFEFFDPLETGSYAVFVTPPAMEPQPNVVVRKVATVIPPRWQDPNTSGMKIEVKQGVNEVVIDLTK